jgi:hypothetical protein
LKEENTSSPLESFEKSSAQLKRRSYFAAMIVSSVFLILIWVTGEVFNPAFFIIWLVFILYLINRVTSFEELKCPECRKIILTQENPDTCPACGTAYYEEQEEDKETPLCIHCMSEVSRNSYYCKKCGMDSGQLTPYIPFVNIRFLAQFYVVMWRIATGKTKGSWIIRLLCMLILFICIYFLSLPYL